MNSFILMIILILFGLGIQIVSGVYLYNIVIIVFLLCNLDVKKINGYYFSFFLLIIISLILITTLQLIIDKNEFELLKGFYLPLKIVILSFVYVYIYRVLDKSNNDKYIKYVLFFSLFPLVLSVAMYLNSSISNILTAFYNIEPYPNPWRFGGIYGKDVNALGIYASTVLLFIMLSGEKFNVVIKLSVSLLCIYVSIISGMRTGLILISFILLLKLFMNKNYKVIFCILIVIVLSPLFAFLLSLIFNSDMLLHIGERFSLQNLFNDLNDNGGGNLSVAIDYYNRVTDNKVLTLKEFLFGFDVMSDFVDNLYFFIFVKYGIFPVLIFILFILFEIKKRYQILNIVLLNIFILLVSIKGIFPLNSSFVFLISFIYVNNLIKLKRCNKLLVLD